MDLFEISGFHFKPIKSTNNHRPYRIKCLETLDEKDSALSYQDAANLLITPILSAIQKLKDDSQNIDYVRTVFERVLIGRRKSECDALVKKEIFERNLIEGKILSYRDTERFAEYKVYRTDFFEVRVLFEHGLMCGATNIIISPIQIME